MPTCKADDTIQRVQVGSFSFPLGVYPVEPMQPVKGYTVEFESADGDNEGEWEEWPDRYVYDIVVSAERIEPLWRQLQRLLPARVYPILDYMGHDAFREIDPYISYDLLGLERVVDAVRRYRDFFFEDGLVGFGAACDDPFIYVFIDEHKVVTVRVGVPMREKLEALLEAFDIPAVEEAAGADAAAHEHRGVLATPPERPELLSAEEVLERLRDEWRLILNVDPDTNLDDEGQALGLTAWRCLVRTSTEKHPAERYAEVILVAPNLMAAEETAGAAVDGLLEEDPGDWVDSAIVSADRITAEDMSKLTGKSSIDEALSSSIPAGEGSDERACVLAAAWLS